jgi:hypothetical protein
MKQQDICPQLDIITQCAVQCERCAYDVCFSQPEMKECGQYCVDCALICWTTASCLGRGSQIASQMLQVCAQACQQCAQACQQCSDPATQMCAQICAQCAQECQTLSRQFAQV